MTTILVAEGEPLFREGLVQLLATQRDLELVGEASDTREAIDRTRAARPDLALVALDLPGLGGPETAHRIRAVSPGTRVIMLVPPHLEEAEPVVDAADAVLVRNARATQVFTRIRAVADGSAFGWPCGDDATWRSASLRLDALTPREREVFGLVAEGWTNRQIERALGIRASTVKRHVRHILRKLRVRNRVQAAVFAARLSRSGDEGVVA